MSTDDALRIGSPKNTADVSMVCTSKHKSSCNMATAPSTAYLALNLTYSSKLIVR